MVGTVIFNALSIAAIYTLVSVGLALVFGVMGIPNFAHGALYTLGAFITYALCVQAGLGYILAIIGAMGTLGLIGVILEKSLFYPLRKKMLPTLIITMAIMMGVPDLIPQVWGHMPRIIPSPFIQTISIGGLVVSLQRVVSIIIALSVMGLIYFFIMKTKTGAGIRGVAQDSEAASLMGVSIKKMRLIVLALGTALAALAGGLVGPLFSIYSHMGDLILLKAFAAVVLGGLGSIFGCVAGCLVLGFAEAFSGAYISTLWKDVFAFVILIIILIVRPHGLFGKKETVAKLELG